MRIAIAQMNTVPGEFEQTVGRMVEQSRSAASQGAELIIFSAATLTGIDAASMARSEAFSVDLAAAIDTLARDLACPALVSVQLPLADHPATEAILISDGQPMPLRLLSWIEHVDTGMGQMHPAEGVQEQVGFEFEGVRLAVVMGVESLEALCDHPDGADITIFLQTGAFSIDDEESMLAPAIEISGYQGIAGKLGSWLVGVGGVGGYDAQVLCGGSFCMAPWGELLGVAPSFEENLLVLDLDVRDEGPLEHPIKLPQLQRARMLWDALVLVTHDYLAKAGVSDAVIPLEGDLATSALAALAVDALGPVHVHAVVLDSGSELRLADARSLARNLRIDVLEELRPPEGAPEGLAEGLLAASIAAHARALDALPLGSHDKTFWALECESYVPSAALFEPFGDVYRSDVAAMMRYRLTVSPVADPAVLSRFRVPELSPKVPGTTPEERLSAIDACLLMLVERGGGPAGFLEDEPEMAPIAELALSRLADCELYRRASPIAPVVSARTLAELALLSGTSWRERLIDERELSDAMSGQADFAPGFEHVHEALEQAMEQIARAVESGAVQTGEGMERVSDVLAILQELSWQGMQGDDSVFGWGLFSRN